MTRRRSWRRSSAATGSSRSRHAMPRRTTSATPSGPPKPEGETRGGPSQAAGGPQPLHAHARDEPLHLSLLEHARAEVLGRLGPAGHGEAQAVLELTRAVAGGHEPGEEGVARADGRDRLERLPRRAGERG